jgi:shikimate kinase
VNLIFEIEGEPAFRERESRLLDAITRRSGILLATGGGAVLAPINRERMRERGFVVYLKTDVQLQIERLRRDRARPLMQVADPAQRLRELAAVRNALYQQTADLVWDSVPVGPRQAAHQIAQLLKQLWCRVEQVPSACASSFEAASATGAQDQR